MNPKFLYLKLAENNARADVTENDGFTLRTESGRTVGQIKYPKRRNVFIHEDPNLITKPDWTVQHALNALCQFDSAMLRVRKDNLLTIEGKRIPAARAAEAAVKTLTWVDKELRNYAADTKNIALHHYAVPEFDPNNMMGFLREQEIRTWINSLGDKATAKLAGPLQTGTNRFVSLAILRSPIPFDGLAEMAEKGWRVVRDREAPDTAQTIAIADELTDWASPWVKVAAGMVKRDAVAMLPAFDHMLPSEARELFEAA